MLNLGDILEVKVRGRKVSAVVLAKSGGDVLVELRRESGCTSLRILYPEWFDGDHTAWQHISYQELNRQWLKAIGEREWVGTPCTGQKPSGQPAELAVHGNTKNNSPVVTWAECEFDGSFLALKEVRPHEAVIDVDTCTTTAPSVNTPIAQFRISSQQRDNNSLSDYTTYIVATNYMRIPPTRRPGRVRSLISRGFSYGTGREARNRRIKAIQRIQELMRNDKRQWDVVLVFAENRDLVRQVFPENHALDKYLSMVAVGDFVTYLNDLYKVRYAERDMLTLEFGNLRVNTSPQEVVLLDVADAQKTCERAHEDRERVAFTHKFNGGGSVNIQGEVVMSAYHFRRVRIDRSLAEYLNIPLEAWVPCDAFFDPGDLHTYTEGQRVLFGGVVGFIDEVDNIGGASIVRRLKLAEGGFMPVLAQENNKLIRL